MPKKIVDISAPSKSAGVPSKVVSNKSVKRNKKSFSIIWKIAASVVAVAVVVVLIMTMRSNVEVDIYPRIEPITFKDTIEVNVDLAEIDFENKVIAGEFFETEVEKWQQFASTGVSENSGKAKGRIRIYNSHTPAKEISLRATTRFLSADGAKIFRTAEKVYIPASKIVNGETVPGSVEIIVSADEVGSEYNIGPSKFSVPGLAGTAYYYTISAESDSQMIGGFKDEVGMVSDEDIENAKNDLDDLLMIEAKQALEAEIDEDFVVLVDGLIKEEGEVNCFQEAGATVAEFSCQGKMKTRVLTFRLSDIKALSNELIKTVMSSSQHLLPESFEFSYRQVRIIVDKGKMIADMTVNAKVYKEIPLEIIPGQIANLSQQDMEKRIFDEYLQVEKVGFKFWPFWVGSAPKNAERIRVKLVVE